MFWDCLQYRVLQNMNNVTIIECLFIVEYLMWKLIFWWPLLSLPLFLINLFLVQYYYFIRLMGRKASHVALECTLQSHPNLVWIPILSFHFLFTWMLCFFGIINISWFQVILGEEVAASKLTLFDITKQICDAVQARAEQGLKLMTTLSYSYSVYIIYVILWCRQEPWCYPHPWGPCWNYSWTLCSPPGIETNYSISSIWRT